MKKPGFFGKQLLLYSVLLFTIVMILIFCAHSYIMDISREKAITSQEQLANSALAQVDSYLDRLLLVATQIAHDTEIVRMMEQIDQIEQPEGINYFTEHPEERAYLSEILAHHNQIKDPMYCIDIYNKRGDYLTTDTNWHHILIQEDDYYPHFLDLAFVRDAREFIMMGPVRPERIDSPDSSIYIFMIMPIKNPEGTQTYGYVEVYQSLASLYQQLDLLQDKTMELYLFNEVNDKPYQQIYPDARNTSFPDAENDDYYQTQLRSYYDWFVILRQNQTVLLADYQNMLVYLYLGGLALFLLLFLCVYLLIRYTSRPILALNSRVKAVTLSNFPDLPASPRSLNEVKELEHSVEHMLHRIKSSVELEQQAYLKALQAQMRPHFLYNCLSTISSLGVEAGSTVIPRFCGDLAALLRYESSYESAPVTLAEELSSVRNYLSLMQIRYEDDLSCTITTDPALDFLPLPRLILQPLAENAFEHGFRAVEPPWILEIHAFCEDDQWVITVSDNGAGFDANTKKQLPEQASQLSKNLGKTFDTLKIGGLGLLSTIVRLQLMCHGNVSFSISDNQPNGTIITLRGNRYASGSDC